MLLTDVTAIERRINWPTSEWEGQCYAVAVEIYKARLVPLKSHVRYGVWFGPISGESHRFAGRALAHHGWIELPDKRIYDPTRFAFEGKPPYIWIGENNEDFYDTAGQRLNQMFYRRCPEASGKLVGLNAKQRRIISQFIPSISGGDPSLEQMLWLAHMPADEMDGQAKSVYKVFDQLKLLAMIPLDHRRYVLEDDKVYV